MGNPLLLWTFHLEKLPEKYDKGHIIYNTWIRVVVRVEQAVTWPGEAGCARGGKNMFRKYITNPSDKD